MNINNWLERQGITPVLLVVSYLILLFLTGFVLHLLYKQ